MNPKGEYMTKEEVRHLRDKLKSGEYDGSDIMQAWIWVEALCAERDRYREALVRLGSMEAFTFGGVLDKVRDAELLARIQYAREMSA